MRLITIFLISFLSINQVKAQIGRFANQTEIGLLAGENVPPIFSARSFNGIRFKNVPLETGIALGVDAYSQITIVPVSLSCRWNPLEKESVSPYLSLDMGYGFDWLQRRREGRSYSGGYLLSPAAGLRFKTAGNSKFILNLSYKRQEASISTVPDMEPFNTIGFRSYQTSDYIFKRLYISVGLSF